MPLYTLSVVYVREETPRTRVVRLALGDDTFDFCAGQYARVGLHGQPLRKPYSIACAPAQARQDGVIELLVQVGSDGSAGEHLLVPAAGASYDLEGPYGSFCFPRQTSARSFLFIAGGTGIAPIRAMLWETLARFPDRGIALVYSARSSDEFAYGKEVRELALNGRIALRETVTRDPGQRWSGERGRITRAQVAALVREPVPLCFVCGPAAMVADVSSWLNDLGVPEDRVVTEGWSSEQ